MKNAEWEAEQELTDASWDYYQRWLIALERMAIESELIDETELEQRTAELINCKHNETK